MLHRCGTWSGDSHSGGVPFFVDDFLCVRFQLQLEHVQERSRFVIFKMAKAPSQKEPQPLSLPPVFWLPLHHEKKGSSRKQRSS